MTASRPAGWIRVALLLAIAVAAAVLGEWLIAALAAAVAGVVVAIDRRIGSSG